MNTRTRMGGLIATSALLGSLFTTTGPAAFAAAEPATPAAAAPAQADVHRDAATKNAAGDQPLLDTYRK
jgi:hypothetical protein